MRIFYSIKGSVSLKIRDLDAMAARGQAHVLSVGKISAKDKTNKVSYQSSTAARMNCREYEYSPYHRRIVRFDHSVVRAFDA